MSSTTRLVTAEELERFPSDDYRYELVDGRLMRMSPVGFEHGVIVARVMWMLTQHVRERRPGKVLTEVGFKLRSTPDTVRAPDVSFISQHRIPSPSPKGFWAGPPDLAIEVLSPDERPSEVAKKVQEYLTHGVPLVVVIDPDERTATVHRPAESGQRLVEDDILDLDPLIPGFSCKVSAIFAED